MAAPQKTITGTVTNITRMPSSKNNNPRYTCMIGDTEVRTQPDSKLGYGLSNFENKNVTATVQERYGTLALINIKAIPEL